MVSRTKVLFDSRNAVSVHTEVQNPNIAQANSRQFARLLTTDLASACLDLPGTVGFVWKGRYASLGWPSLGIASPGSWPLSEPSTRAISLFE